jgi:hypothetical protein
MQPPRSLVCVICGARPATTREHVPPQGFFKGMSGQLRTVPSCNICNNGSSEDDETLRNYISAQIGKQTDGAKNLWEKGAHKSLRRSNKLRSELLRTLQEVEVTNEDGTSTTRLGFIVPVSLYQRVFERVTRGLYFWHTCKILPPDTPVKINLLNNAPKLSRIEQQLLAKHSISDGAFEYSFILDHENSCNGVWLFAVHGSHWVQSSTGIPARI